MLDYIATPSEPAENVNTDDVEADTKWFVYQKGILPDHRLIDLKALTLEDYGTLVHLSSSGTSPLVSTDNSFG